MLLNVKKDKISIYLKYQHLHKFYSLYGFKLLKLIHSKDFHGVLKHFDKTKRMVYVAFAFNQMVLYNFSNKHKEIRFTYPNLIVGLKCNSVQVAVCLERSVHIHNIKNMSIQTILRIPSNPRGKLALSNRTNYLAYPGCSDSGEVEIYDINTKETKIKIYAHDSRLAALAFSPGGTRIATASDKDSYVRVFSVTDGSMLFEFSTGSKCSIDYLEFSKCGVYLCGSNNLDRVYVFKLNVPYRSKQMVDEKETTVYKTVPPFAIAECDIDGLQHSITVASIKGEMRLLVATVDSWLSVYNLQSDGGKLKLFQKLDLDNFIKPPKFTKSQKKSDAPTGDILNSFLELYKKFHKKILKNTTS